MNAWHFVVTLFLLIPCISGCITQQPAEHHSWTIMIYMAGDSSLSSYIDKTLDEMMTVGSSKNLNIIVLSDKLGNGNAGLYLIKKNELINLTLNEIWIKRPSEIETGRPETLESFLNYSIRNYSADHTMLVVWGHGNGWKGAAGDGEDLLSLPDMKRALAGYKIDIIAFDACAMATIEVYYEIESVAKYIIASEKTAPTAGWPYGEILAKIGARTPDQVGRMIVDEYMDAYENNRKDPEKFSILMSLLKTRTGLSSAFKEFVAGNRQINYSKALRFEQQEFADVQSIINDQNISKMIQKTVIRLGHWNNPAGSIDVSSASGLAIYCPENAFDEAYKGTTLAQNTRWDEILVDSSH